MSNQIVDPESSSIYGMIAALKEAGVEKDSAVFQTMLTFFTELRALEGLVEEAHKRSEYWHERAMRAERRVRKLTRD